MEGSSEAVVLETGSVERLDEAALVLASQSIPCWDVPVEGGFQLHVFPPDEASAQEALRAYAEDEALARTRGTQTPPGVEGWDLGLGALAAAALTELSLWTGPAEAPSGRWFERGVSDWGLLAHEPWRAVTALTLHADSAHLVGNALFGLLFFGAVGARFGRGLGLVLLVLAGVAGNVASGAWLGAGHALLGASTAVFGGIGLVAGAVAVARAARGRWARPWTPVGLTVCFLAELGADPGAAISAHLFGALAGLALGSAAGLVWERPPGRATQALLAAGGVLLVAGSWVLALCP